jgi:hypothetical protein
MTERFKIPSSYADEAEMAAITARLRPLAESETMRHVLVTYWREGDDLPLRSHIFASPTLFNWRRFAPFEATHLSIEVPADG